MGVQRQQEKSKELLCDKKTQVVTSVNMRNMGCGLEIVLRNNNGP